MDTSCITHHTSHITNHESSIINDISNIKHYKSHFSNHASIEHQTSWGKQFEDFLLKQLKRQNLEARDTSSSALQHCSILHGVTRHKAPTIPTDGKMFRNIQSTATPQLPKGAQKHRRLKPLHSNDEEVTLAHAKAVLPRARFEDGTYSETTFA